MYELIDARTHGQDVARPLLITEKWGNTYRLVFQLRACDLPFAKEILQRMNEVQDAA